ncbi:LamG-like jellyroll fold domain-containing protein [Dactylosporangium sp. NPDC005555]|uniref:LamG-like jellyroll fold domain-containing protein n=1 Tax=Dactylosporangium sp. NPDC005555 TaxID=3154889 RepID=UPI0033BE6AE8
MVRVGYQNFSGVTTARSVFEMDTSGLIGKQLKSASFSITQSWSGKACGGTAGAAELWWTSPISSGMTWNSASSGLQWNAKLASNSQTRRYNGSGACAPGRVEWDAAAAVQSAINTGSSATTLGLRETGETDPYAWRRYQLDPKLTVEYNSFPSAPDQFVVASTAQEPGLACAPGTVPTVRATPTFRVRAVDVDADSLLSVTFKQQRYVSPQLGWASMAPDLIVQNVPSSGTAAATVTWTQSDGRYRIWAQTTDGNGTGVSGPQSAICEYLVDGTPPGTPAAVTSTTYPSDGQFHGGRGVTGTFTVTPPTTNPGDVQKYAYALTPTTGLPADGTRTVTADPVTRAATIHATPSKGGENLLRVWALDAAGNVSNVQTPLEYTFKVDDPAMALGQWRLDDPAGATTLYDYSGYERHGSIVRATTGVPGPMINGWTATLIPNGLPTERVGAVVPRPFASNSTFSVAAWVNLGGSRSSVVAGAGPGPQRVRGEPLPSKSFHLMYEADTCGGWAFRYINAAGAISLACAQVPAPTGVWTHLAGVYDSGAQTITLYVDGIARATVAVTGMTADATGSLTLGYSAFGMFDQQEKLVGQLSDVQVWNRAIFPDEVASLIGPPGGVPASGWEFDGNGDDIVGRAPLQQSASLTYGPNRDGTPNAAAVFTGTGAYGVTTGPVLRTEQSYTLSAWVKLTDAAGGSRTVLSQSTSAGQPAFQLLYDGTCHGWTFGMLATPGATTRTDACAPTPAALNTWTHLVAVHNASTRTMALYVDGTQVTTVAAPATPFFADGPVSVGRVVRGGAAAEPFAGSIDEVALYPGALPAAAVVLL